MKNTYIFLIGLFLLLVVGLSFASHPYYYGGYEYSTRSYYSVVFDERGLANVMLRLDYTNIDKNNVSGITINIPGSDIKLIGVFVKSECEPTRIPYDNGVVEYDYNGCYSYYKLEPANVTKISEGVYRVELPKSLAKGEQTQLLLYYRAFGYVKGGLGTKDFDFQTAKFDFDVDSTRVAINTDDDLFIKGGETSADYKTTFGAPAAMASYGWDYSKAEVQNALSGSYDYISYAPGYVKEKSTLLSGEVFHVNGAYGKSRLLLYAPEIVSGLSIFGILAYVIHKKAKPQPESKSKQGTGLAHAAVYSFIAALVFSIIASLVFLLAIQLYLFNEARVILLSLIGAWILSAFFLYKIMPANQLAAVGIYLGFSLIMTPIIFGGLSLLFYLLFPPVYYQYGGVVPMAD